MKIFILALVSLTVLCGAVPQTADPHSFAVHDASQAVVLPTFLRGMSPFTARTILDLRRQIAHKKEERKELQADVDRLQEAYDSADDRFREATRMTREYEVCQSEKSLLFERCKQRGTFYEKNRDLCARRASCGSRSKLEEELEEAKDGRDMAAEKLRDAVTKLTRVRVQIQRLEKRVQNISGNGRGVRPSAEPRAV